MTARETTHAHVRSPTIESGWAWGTVGLTAAFIAITCWWLNHDRGVPFGDVASHLYAVIQYHDLFHHGHLGALWTRREPFPPMTYIVGALATLVRFHPDAPVVAENVVYGSLLALGCYQTGRLISGPQAGFLAAAFALGSPLLIEQFHLFTVDAPAAALVAVSVWLILASDRFSRVGVAAAAGLAVGVGLVSGRGFLLYVVGVLAVVLVRSRGWRNWRGILTFVAVACVVAGPWYLRNLSSVGSYAAVGAVGSGSTTVHAASHPSLISLSNLGWYTWATLNGLLFAPLFVLAAIGVGRSVLTVAQGRAGTEPGVAGRGALVPELLGGLFVAWIAISLTPRHDMRYAMSLIVYLAVLGTAWIVGLARVPRMAALAGLALALLATTLGASFGVAGDWRISFGHRPSAAEVSAGIPPRSQITLYADHDFLVSGPRHGGDVYEVMTVLRAAGDKNLSLHVAQAPVNDQIYEYWGILVLASFAKLAIDEQASLRAWTEGSPPAALIREPSLSDATRFYIGAKPTANPPPCIVLRDGTQVWVARAPATLYCPARLRS